MSQLFAWGGQSTGVYALASFLPKKSQGWSPSEWTGWISLQSKGLSRVFSNTTVQKHQFFGAQLSSHSNSHIHTWPLEKTIALTRQTFVGKVMFLLFNMLSRLVITFLSRSNRLLISWLQSPSAVIWFVFGTVSLQFQGWFVSISWGQFLESWQPMSWLESGHRVVNLSTWWGFQCLQDSSWDMAQNVIYSLWGRAKSSWLCFMTTLLSLFGLLWLFSFVSACSHFSD